MYIKIIVLNFILLILLTAKLNAGLLINEIACATSGEDWVEIFYYSNANDSLEISDLYVTMYYGTNERLANDSVTIYSFNRPETQYDDRFIVIHLTEENITDETDSTGDTNQNGYIDIYCNNYYASLWNSDCIVAIDTDDEPSNGGIIDFVAYSNRDGTANSTIESYVEAAQALNQWASSEGNIQECMVYIGQEGIEPYMTISRKSTSDTNSQEDFTITKYMTPGKENVLNESVSEGGDIFKANKKKISFTPDHFAKGNGELGVFVFECCNIRLRIFSSIGMLVYESPLYRNINPGNFIMNWNLKGLGRNAGTGLYIAQIEATSKELKKSQKERIYVILSRYR